MIFLFTIIRRHTSLVSDWSSDVFSSDLRRFGGALEQMTLRVYGEAVTTSDESATESAGAGKRYLERRLRRSEGRRVGKRSRFWWSGVVRLCIVREANHVMIKGNCTTGQI